MHKIGKASEDVSFSQMISSNAEPQGSYEATKDVVSELSSSIGDYTGLKMLLEFDPSVNYERTAIEFIVETARKAQAPVAITHLASTLYQELKRETDLVVISLSFGTSGTKDLTSNEISLPQNDVGRILETLERISRSHPEKRAAILLDNLTDLTLCLGFVKCYYFAVSMLEILKDATILCLVNSEALTETENSAYRALFSNILSMGRRGLEIRKWLRADPRQFMPLVDHSNIPVADRTQESS